MLFNEIGHDFDRVTWSESVAEFNAVRCDLESLVHFPNLYSRVGFRIPEYAMEINIARAGYEKYGAAAYAAFLSIIKNRGNLSLAQADVNWFFVGEFDEKFVKDTNGRGPNSLSSTYLPEEVKDAAISAYLQARELDIREDLRSGVFQALSKRETRFERRLILPPGIVYPANYDAFRARARENELVQSAH